MTYDEAIAFWFGRINYEVRSAAPKDLKLERMRALLRLLGDPHDRLRVVHVTGTKGKGSTCAMLDAVLRSAGYRVGLFTSPHLVRVEERIQVDGVPLSREELAARMAEVAPAVKRLEVGPWPPPTFFEISTALAFLHFAYRRVEVAVVEVGLGGRFDSTNVCRPLVSVVTSVGLDHTAQLGDTLEAIAYQKAGVIKRRVPVVSGVTQPGPRAVIEREARDHGCRLVQAGREFRYRYEAALLLPLSPAGRGAGGEGFGSLPPWGGGLGWGVEGVTGQATSPPTGKATPHPNPPPQGGREQEGRPLTPLPFPQRGEGDQKAAVTVVTTRRHWPAMALGLLGEHQAANAAVVVATVEHLRDAGLSLPDAAVARGLREVRWPARVELVSERPAVVLDSAHNVPSAEALVATLREAMPVAGRKAVVFAVSADKPYPDILRVLAGFFDHFHLTRYGHNPRCVPPEKLAAVLAEVAPAKTASLHPSADAAWAAARAVAGPDDLVCVTGSVFLAGELQDAVRSGVI